MIDFRPAARRTLATIGVAAALIGAGTTAAAAPPNLPGPMPPAANRRLARDIFRDLVEIRSVHAVGTAGTAAVLVRYLKAHGFTDSEIRVLPDIRAR